MKHFMVAFQERLLTHALRYTHNLALLSGPAELLYIASTQGPRPGQRPSYEYGLSRVVWRIICTCCVHTCCMHGAYILERLLTHSLRYAHNLVLLPLPPRGSLRYSINTRSTPGQRPVMNMDSPGWSGIHLHLLCTHLLLHDAYSCMAEDLCAG